MLTRSKAALLMGLCVVVGNAQAESVTGSISFPQEIGELKFQELHQPTEDDSSTRVAYGAPGMALTLIIYGGSSDLPDGIESKWFKSEYENTKSALKKSGAWDKVKLLDERTVEMGSTHIQAREASFKVTKKGVVNLSYLCLSASNHVLFKIRFTVSGGLSDSAQAHLPLIRSAVGQVISDFNASSKGAT